MDISPSAMPRLVTLVQDCHACNSARQVDLRHIPSLVAPYPALPRLPIVHRPGQKPEAWGLPGRETETSKKAPPLKQSLFHVCSIPERKLRP